MGALGNAPLALGDALLALGDALLGTGTALVLGVGFCEGGAEAAAAVVPKAELSAL